MAGPNLVVRSRVLQLPRWRDVENGSTFALWARREVSQRHRDAQGRSREHDSRWEAMDHPYRCGTMGECPSRAVAPGPPQSPVGDRRILRIRHTRRDALQRRVVFAGWRDVGTRESQQRMGPASLGSGGGIRRQDLPRRRFESGSVARGVWKYAGDLVQQRRDPMDGIEVGATMAGPTCGVRYDRRRAGPRRAWIRRPAPTRVGQGSVASRCW